MPSRTTGSAYRRVCSPTSSERAGPVASDRAARSIVDHMRIIEALEKRDTELAERLVRQHSLDLAAHVDKYGDFLE